MLKCSKRESFLNLTYFKFPSLYRFNIGANEYLVVPFGSDLELQILTTFVDEGLTLTECAARFGIPRSTLWRMIRVRHGVKPFKATVIFCVHFAPHMA